MISSNCELLVAKLRPQYVCRINRYIRTQNGRSLAAFCSHLSDMICVHAKRRREEMKRVLRKDGNISLVENDIGGEFEEMIFRFAP